MSKTIYAAGVMFLDPDGRALFVRRAEGDMTGSWAFPGGKVEEGETAEEAALRECREEIGKFPKGTLKLHSRRRAPAHAPEAPIAGPVTDAPTEDVIVDFTTFIQRVPQQFIPTLNEEHDGFVWGSLQEAPEPLHPGVRVAIAKLYMNELEIARAMAFGDLTSPQRYHNMTMWAMRITGTGQSFRKGQKRKDDTGVEIIYDEHVYRPPEHYLKQEFLDRCSGLPVIWDHPPNATLDSKEFARRTVGTVLFPYVQGDEVWGIAKVYDDKANEELEKNQLSTSPTVVFTALSVNTSLALDDGSVILIEGEPALLDHLAICERGVWDKGGEPSGVSNDHITKGDSEMAEKDEKKEDAVKSDTNNFDAVMDALRGVADSVSSLCKRMDSVEEERKADKVAADAAKADAAKKSDEEKDEKKDDAAKADGKKADGEDEDGDAKKTAADEDKDKDKDEKKEDAVKSDSVVMSKADFAALTARITGMESRIPVALADEDVAKFADAQAKADSVLQVHGQHAPRHLNGESLIAYQIRLARMMQPHSTKWKGIDLAKIAADSVAFEGIVGEIRADAIKAGMSPVGLPEGVERIISKRDETTGRIVNSFVGGSTMFKRMSTPARAVSFIGARSRNH